MGLSLERYPGETVELTLPSGEVITIEVDQRVKLLITAPQNVHISRPETKKTRSPQSLIRGFMKEIEETEEHLANLKLALESELVLAGTKR